MSNRIYLYGSVGGCWWDEDYFTAADVRDQLAGMSGPLTVHINSGGGIATEGQAIYTMLVDYPDEVTVQVDGIAASAASLIAMAGDQIVMRLGSYMLIHDPAQPWTEGRGTEADHLRLAEQLAVTSGAYADIYAQRAGISRDEARGVMKDETFLDGLACVEMGFATRYDGASQAVVAAKFDYRIYAKAPAALRDASAGFGQKPAREAVMAMMAGLARPKAKAQPHLKNKESVMVEIVKNEEQSEVTAVTEEDVEAVEVPEGADTAQITASAVKAERQRALRIRHAVMVAKLPESLANELIEKGVGLDKAIDQITMKWKEEGDVDTPMHGRETAKVGIEAREKFVKGATMALMAKTNQKGGERNEFSSLSLAELARASIEVAGERVKATHDRQQMVGHAFTMAGSHTTSDFGNILANVMGKAALQGWEESAETFDRWTRKGTLTDFKATKRVGAGLFASLPVIAEGAEYTNGTVGDRGENITLATYGRMLRISRQAIINDDLELLGTVPRKMGRAARATVGNLVYAILTGNPVLSDGVALFHATHNNLAGSGAALSVASLSAGRAAMRIQKEASGGQPLNITPKYLLVPAALETTALQLINSSVDPTLTKGMALNPVNGMAEVIVDGRLDAASVTAWYLTSDALAFDTIEVAYLDGNDAPYLEEQTAWTSDGVEMKVRIDATAAPLDFRTFYKNPGA